MSQGCLQSIPVINYDELVSRMMGSVPMAVRMLERFLNSANSDCDLLESTVRMGDRRAVASLAHRHRGAAQTMAAPRVAKLACEIEQSAAVESISNLLSLIDQLRAHIDEVRKEVAVGIVPGQLPTPR